MSDKKVIKCKFPNNKNTALAKRKRRARFLAIIGAILMVSGLIGSIMCYL